MTDLISVMIVDDEKLMLEDLSTMIDWEAYGYQIIATAFNGKQALRKYRISSTGDFYRYSHALYGWYRDDI